MTSPPLREYLLGKFGHDPSFAFLKDYSPLHAYFEHLVSLGPEALDEVRTKLSTCRWAGI